MSSPSVRVNTFLQESNEVYIDPISKIFIISEAAFGFFRLPFIRKRKLPCFLVAVFYIVSLHILYFSYAYLNRSFVTIMLVAHVTQYIFCSVFGFVCIKRLQLYYSTLNRFDIDVGCRPKVSKHSLQILAQMILTVVMHFAIVKLPSYFGSTKKRSLHYVFMHIACTLEVDYYGHLLNLLVPRLKLINHYVQSSLSNVKSESSSLMKEFVSLKRGDAITEVGHCRMTKLMDLYHIMVEAYDYLIDAIKWQLLVTIISSFISILGFLYFSSLNVIKGGQDIIESLLLNLTLAALIMIPLFAPCTFGDKVHHEVKRLRELLASRLYENKLDKSGRSIARALLAFTETRDLSFRLLRMVNIDISLPFKFMGLLVTYLIILLQFEKVINPGTDIDNSSNRSVS